jgi:hypothetical protein
MQARGQLAKFPRRVRRERARGRRRQPVRSCGRTASEALCGHADSPLPRPVENAEEAARHACWGSRGHGSGGPPPDDFEERILDIDVVDEMQGSFLEYAYSVIYSRALPGRPRRPQAGASPHPLPMNEMGLRPDRGYVKCARVVGEVMGKLHPHGDARSTTPWSAWPSPSPCACPWSTATATSARWATTTRPPPCGTPRRGWPARRWLMTESIDEDTVDFRPELRRPGAGAVGPAGRLPEPAGQRHVGHRGRHGDQHGAAQPRRGHRRRPAPDPPPRRRRSTS